MPFNIAMLSPSGGVPSSHLISCVFERGFEFLRYFYFAKEGSSLGVRVSSTYTPYRTFQNSKERSAKFSGVKFSPSYVAALLVYRNAIQLSQRLSHII